MRHVASYGAVTVPIPLFNGPIMVGRMDQAPEVSPAELEIAIAHIRSGKPPRLMNSSTAELFEAVRLGIVDKAEARRLLGFEAKRGRAAAALPRSPRGRFRTSTTA